MLVQTFSWRWIFFATLPVVIVTFALACAWLKTEPSPITPPDSKPVFADGSAVALIHAYLCVRTRHFYRRERNGHVLPPERGQYDTRRNGHAYAAVVCGFVLAITATGRYFNRIGPRPLVVIGCLLQATGILLLVNVGPAMLLPAVAFALMGAGKPLQQYGSEQRVYDDATGKYA